MAVPPLQSADRPHAMQRHSKDRSSRHPDAMRRCAICHIAPSTGWRNRTATTGRPQSGFAIEPPQRLQNHHIHARALAESASLKITVGSPSRVGNRVYRRCQSPQCARLSKSQQCPTHCKCLHSRHRRVRRAPDLTSACRVMSSEDVDISPSSSLHFRTEIIIRRLEHQPSFGLGCSRAAIQG